MSSSATPWTEACQAPLSMGFPRQEYWSGLPFPFPGGLSDPGMEPVSPTQSGKWFTTEAVEIICNTVSTTKGVKWPQRKETGGETGRSDMRNHEDFYLFEKWESQKCQSVQAIRTSDK